MVVDYLHLPVTQWPFPQEHSLWWAEATWHGCKNTRTSLETYPVFCCTSSSLEMSELEEKQESWFLLFGQIEENNLWGTSIHPLCGELETWFQSVYDLSNNSVVLGTMPPPSPSLYLLFIPPGLMYVMFLKRRCGCSIWLRESKMFCMSRWFITN